MNQLSLRTTLGLTIIVMGLLGVGLALVSGEIHRDLTLANQREAFSELVRIKARDLLRDLEDKSRDVGLHLQRDPAFRRQVETRDLGAIDRHLNEQFHQYYVTAGVIKLEKLFVLDLNFNRIVSSQEGAVGLGTDPHLCAGLIGRAQQRAGAARLQTLAGLCLHGNKAYQGVIVPLGGLRPTGYVMAVADPTPNLAAIESALGMPVRIAGPDGRVAYESRAWPRGGALASALLAEHTLDSESGQPALTLAIANDVRPLEARLAGTRWLVILVAGLVTLVTVLAGLLVLRKTTLLPLTTLKQHLLAMQQDRTRLGEPIHLAGNSDINELAQGFNQFGGEIKRLYRALEQMAYTDALTELPNRACFNTSLDALTRRGTPFALFLIDLDRFKEINDLLGHDIGDQLLKDVGSRLNGVLRQSDLVVRLDGDTVSQLNSDVIARLGGDEFAGVLPGVDSAERAAVVAHKLILALNRPFVISGHTLTIGLSIGFALYPEHGSDALTLLREADVAMYHAKQNRTGYALYDKERHRERVANAELEQDLRQAIDHGALELHYQPKINIQSNSVCGVEALLRWRHPTKGPVAPDKFIPIAEQSGLIHPLTLWVLDQSLKDCANWIRSGMQIGVAINVSAANLRDPRFADHVGAALSKHNLAPSALTLELTESVVMHDPVRSMEMLNCLDRMGVGLSIDDFGTGYSSLSYLKQLPVDEIKIDRSFVKDMKPDGNDAVIVRATIDLAHNMGLRVVAEGVETGDALALLAGHGCDLAQGYHISRPMARGTLLEWLRNQTACSAREAPNCAAPSAICLAHPGCA